MTTPSCEVCVRGSSGDPDTVTWIGSGVEHMSVYKYVARWNSPLLSGRRASNPRPSAWEARLGDAARCCQVLLLDLSFTEIGSDFPSSGHGSGHVCDPADSKCSIARS